MMWKDRTMHRGSLAAWLVLGASALAGGCYQPDQVGAFLQQPRSPVSAEEYRVLPPDVLAISSTRVPEIDRFQGQIRPDGRINLPLVGEVYVADKTPQQIQESLKEAARKYYEEVDATVQVVSYNSRRIFVFGQVGRPGPLPYTGCDTLLDVLAIAQPTPLAWPERIIVIRGAGPTQGGQPSRPSLKYSLTGVNEFGDATTQPAATTRPAEPATQGATQEVVASGQREAPVPQKLTVNLMAMVQHGDMANNILLRPNDIVYVQANPFAKVSLGIEKVFMPVRAATDGLSDLRELQSQWKWVEDHFPAAAAGAERARIIAR